MRDAYRHHSVIGHAIWSQLREYARANTYHRLAVHVGATANTQKAVDLYRAMASANFRIDSGDMEVMDAVALVRGGSLVGNHRWMGKR